MTTRQSGKRLALLANLVNSNVWAAALWVKPGWIPLLAWVLATLLCAASFDWGRLRRRLSAG